MNQLSPSPIKPFLFKEESSNIPKKEGSSTK
jgi:hypothetical protein